MAKFLALRSSADAPVEASEWDGLFMFANIVKVADGLLQTHAIDGLCSLASVLEVDAKVGAASLGGLCWVDGRCCVADHGASKYLSGPFDFVVAW